MNVATICITRPLSFVAVWLLLLYGSTALAVGGLRHTYTGTLDAASPTTESFRYPTTVGFRYLSHTIVLDAPDVLFTYLHSDDFDAYLVVTDADGQVLIESDNLMGTDALATIQLPRAGTYHLYAAAKEYGEGDYRLFMQLGAAQPNRQYTGALGTRSAMIHDGTFAEVFPFYGHAGQTITVWAKSDAFESSLSMIPPGITSSERVNDQAVLRYTLQRDGYHNVFVHSYGDFGEFSLKISNNETYTAPSHQEAFPSPAPKPVTHTALGLTGPVHTLQTYVVINGTIHVDTFHVFDPNGNEVERRTRFGEHYRWDTGGQLLERANKEVTEYYTYTESGELLSVWLHDPSRSGEPYLSRAYQYDTDGKLAQRVDYDEDGFVQRVLRYVYSKGEDYHGQFVRREAFDSKNEEVETITTYYDDEGRIIREEQLGGWMQGGTRQNNEMVRVTQTASYEYDPSGRLKCERRYSHRCFNERGQITYDREFSYTQGANERRYIYDEAGRLQYEVRFSDSCAQFFCYTVTRFDQYEEDSWGNWTSRRVSQAQAAGTRYDSLDFIETLDFTPQHTEPRELEYWPAP